LDRRGKEGEEVEGRLVVEAVLDIPVLELARDMLELVRVQVFEQHRFVKGKRVYSNKHSKMLRSTRESIPFRSN
jgi:hypothetical protein